MTRSAKRLPNDPLHPVPPDCPPNLVMYTDTQPIHRAPIIKTDNGKAFTVQPLALTIDTLVLPAFAYKMALWQSLIRQLTRKDACVPWHGGRG